MEIIYMITIFVVVASILTAAGNTIAWIWNNTPSPVADYFSARRSAAWRKNTAGMTSAEYRASKYRR